MSNDNEYALTAGECGDAVYHAAKTFFETGIYRPIFIWGDSGIGKTHGVRSAAQRLGAVLNAQHLADREPTEIGGIYWERNGEMVRLQPQDLPTQNGVPTILFYDEAAQAPMMNKNLLARIMLERRIGDYNLGDKVYVCAAGNYMHNRAGTSPMPAQLNARMAHLHARDDVDAWRLWAAGNGVHPFVVAYQHHAPGDHHLPDPTKEASPNPRAWEMVSDIERSGYPSLLRKSMIVGQIGQEVGSRYIAQSQLYANMPDPDAVIANPRKAPIPDNRSTLFALVCALAAKAKGSNLGAIIEYTNRLVGDEEYQAVCLREAKARNPAIAAARDYTQFAMSAKGKNLA